MLENCITIADKKACIKKISENLHGILSVLNEDKLKFSSDDLKDVNGIMECLQELENERFKAHDIWETESIKFEALRNKLVHYPDEITDEIQRAIKAARGMNEETIHHLKDTLEKINSNIDRHTKDLDRFNLENEKLIPEFEQMKVKHEEIVVVLNQHLAKKADKQIDLNEIRNKIRSYNENIVELEEDVFNLKENMIKDRSAAREELKRIGLETNKTQKQLNIQNQKNEELNKIYTNLKHEATETSMIVTDKSTIFQNYVKAIGEISGRQIQIESSIENMMWTNETVKQEIQETERGIIESKCKYEDFTAQINEQIEMLSDGVKRQEDILAELHFVKGEVSEELEKSNKIKDDVTIHLRSLMDKLKENDENSAAKVGNIGQLVFEMEEMEKSIISSKENHEASVAAIKSHIASLKKQLDKERKERTEIQKSNNELQDKINAFRSDHVKLMRDINAKLNESKSWQTRLTTLSIQLKKAIKEETESSERLRKSNDENKQSLFREDTGLTDKISLLNREIFEMEKEENEKRVQLEENEPNLKELQIYYDKYLKDYEKLKKDLVGFKNRKSGLDDALKRDTTSLEKETLALENLLAEKTAKDEKFDLQLQDEARDRSVMEKKIYVVGCKKSTLKEEIARLQHEINKMDQRTRVLRDNWEQAIHITSKIKQEIHGQTCILREGWEDDQNLENIFKNNEISTINRLKDLLKSTEERQVLIADVSNKLFEEISLFDQFINNMATVSSQKTLPRDSDKSRKVADVIGKLVKFNSIINEVKETEYA